VPSAGDYIIQHNLGFGGKHLFEPFLGLVVLVGLYNFTGASTPRRQHLAVPDARPALRTEET
jgi:hypothetical protein